MTEDLRPLYRMRLRAASSSMPAFSGDEVVRLNRASSNPWLTVSRVWREQIWVCRPIMNGHGLFVASAPIGNRRAYSICVLGDDGCIWPISEPHQYDRRKTATDAARAVLAAYKDYLRARRGRSSR